MRKILLYTILLFGVAATGVTPALAQKSIGIGTTSPDSHAALDINSSTKGVLFPSLTTAQQAILAASLSAAEKGMMVTDAATGHLVIWTGTAWEAPAAGLTITATSPLSVKTNVLQINAGTTSGDLLTWDGNNWVNKQPAPQHFSISADNHQPYGVVNYVIAMFGIFPSQNDASEPYVGEIYMMGCNFPPVGFQFCNGQLVSISQNSVLFNLIGTTYGGDGINTYALPNLQGRVPIHQGSNGSTNYIVGQSAGIETMTFTH